MKYFYSPGSKGFYIKKIHGNKIPKDVITLTREEYKKLFNNGSSNIAIGPEGKPEKKPSKYHTLKNDKSGWEILAESQSIKDEKDTEAVRLSAIEEGKKNSGFRKITVEQGHDFIDKRLDRATNLQELREETRKILKKMIPYLID